MKYRKSNRSKQVAGGCGNNKGCPYCEDSRLHNTRTALQDEVDTTRDAIALDVAESQWCDPNEGWWATGEERINPWCVGNWWCGLDECTCDRPEDWQCPLGCCCWRLIPGTFIMCGEGGNYCSEECLLRSHE